MIKLLYYASGAWPRSWSESISRSMGMSDSRYRYGSVSRLGGVTRSGAAFEFSFGSVSCPRSRSVATTMPMSWSASRSCK